MSKKVLMYSLGGGCFPNNDIPIEFRLDSIFKSCWAMKPSVFLPLQLFNGNLELEFLERDWNWDIINVNNNWDSKQIRTFQTQNSKYLSNYLVTYTLVNKNLGWQIEHPHKWKDNPCNKNTYRRLFKDFHENKYNLFYIIDFQRGGYENYTNEQLLDFENFLQKNNYDLNKFVYLDVSNSIMKSRFDNCKIRSFINDVFDPMGFNVDVNKSEFRNTYCFIKKHMYYVNSLFE